MGNRRVCSSIIILIRHPWWCMYVCMYSFVYVCMYVFRAYNNRKFDHIHTYVSFTSGQYLGSTPTTTGSSSIHVHSYLYSFVTARYLLPPPKIMKHWTTYTVRSSAKKKNTVTLNTDYNPLLSTLTDWLNEHDSKPLLLAHTLCWTLPSFCQYSTQPVLKGQYIPKTIHCFVRKAQETGLNWTVAPVGSVTRKK